MKIKYLRLSKKERKIIKKEFNKTKKGAIINKKINNTIICSILLFIISIYLLYESLISYNFLEIIYSIVLIIIAFIFLLSGIKIKIKKINEYVINK